ncbi:MAG TPA: sporulation histidine kinase inhibitor Sda [Metabacillus sp.]|nr:sporulation histidine kinase inhibitor Sda [Metabacillus sp.]
MRFSTLSDKTLLDSLQEAKKLKINIEFIRMLEAEIRERGLHKRQILEKQLRKIN